MGKNKNPRKRQLSDINRETDARFHAQTGYKPGMPLDLKDPSDRAMSKVWLDVYAQVAGENDAGKMVRTFADPKVAEYLDHAKVAHLAAINHMVGASSAKDNAHLESHLRAAKDANVIARESCAAAAAFQPPSITKFILDQALAEVSKTAPIEPTEVPVITSGEDGPVMAPIEQNTAPEQPMLSPENDPWDERYRPPMQADSPPMSGPVMPGDPGWVDYADAKPAPPRPQQPHAEPAPQQPMLAPKNDPWDERYEPPKSTEQAPTPVPGRKGPPPGWKSPPEWKDYTGEKPTSDPGAPRPPSPRKQARSGGPSAGQVLVGVGVTAAFFGVAALVRKARR